MDARILVNNTAISIKELGQDANALLCVTDNKKCCFGDENNDFVADFRNPVGESIGSSFNQGLYITKGRRIIRLNYRINAQASLVEVGQYCCTITNRLRVVETHCVFFNR